jgi:hypothetical protein
VISARRIDDADTISIGLATQAIFGLILDLFLPLFNNLSPEEIVCFLYNCYRESRKAAAFW